MHKKLLTTAALFSSLIASANALAVVTLDKSPTDERADRRALIEAVTKMDKNLAELLEETKKTNALLEEMKNRGVSPLNQRR